MGYSGVVKWHFTYSNFRPHHFQHGHSRMKVPLKPRHLLSIQRFLQHCQHLITVLFRCTAAKNVGELLHLFRAFYPTFKNLRTLPLQINVLHYSLSQYSGWRPVDFYYLCRTLFSHVSHLTPEAKTSLRWQQQSPKNYLFPNFFKFKTS